MRRVFRMILVPFLVGGLILGAAWAGAGLTPAPDVPAAAEKIEPKERKASVKQIDAASAEGAAVADLAPLPNGLVYAGASKISMFPRPEDYDGVWETDPAKCETMSANFFSNLPDNLNHAANAGSPWPENPNCLYMGGFSIGPVNSIETWDETYGLWVRTFAVSDGKDTLVLTVLDGEGYFWDYQKKCTDCGAKQLGQQLGQELGIDPAGIVIAATHSHAAPEFIGGWGFVPDWYMTQIKDTIKKSVTDAVTSMQPAVLETGELLARPFNSERRDTYRSAEEQELTYLRALALNGSSGKPHPTQPQTIATVGAYAAHPTTVGTNDNQASADWVGPFEKGLEDRFGGIGLHFMTGLGNMSASGGQQMGARLADIVPVPGSGITLTNTDIKVAQETWAQPVTNAPLSALGLPGFFDRRFNQSPAQVQVNKDQAQKDEEGEQGTAPCVSGSPVSVELPVTAATIGDQFALSTAPGEVFSNLTNTLKEESGALVTMPLAQANDALGYMPQSFELNPVGQQGLGFVAGGVLIVNYEDSYSIDKCVGDMVLETTIGLFRELRR
ncbi:MAG: hypothetical protein ACRDLB_06335 [Actinomycetota bacterium]